jgi:hypothetical protein
MREGLLQPPKSAMPAEPQSESLPEEAVDDTEGDEFEDDGYFAGGEASEREQAQYDELMGTVNGLLHAPNRREATLKRLTVGKRNIGKAVGDMALDIMLYLEAQTSKEGGKIEESVRLEVGQDLLAEIIETAVAASIIPDDDATLEQVMSQALEVLASKYGNVMREKGYINPEAAQKHYVDLKNGIEDDMASANPKYLKLRSAVQEGNQELIRQAEGAKQ